MILLTSGKTADNNNYSLWIARPAKAGKTHRRNATQGSTCRCHSEEFNARAAKEIPTDRLWLLFCNTGTRAMKCSLNCVKWELIPSIRWWSYRYGKRGDEEKF
jgi:hypothetical protein